MPCYKIVIRRLPPTLSEEDFLKQVSPLPNHDYFCYFEANSGLGQHSYSRAYINFLESNDMSCFRERFDNYVFLDKDGNEYPAVVEQSLWHKSANSGPFYKAEPDNNKIGDNDWNSQSGDPGQSGLASNPEAENSSKMLFLNEDPEFLKFVEKINSQRKTQPGKYP